MIRLADGSGATFSDPAAKARLFDLGFEPMPMNSIEFGKFIGDETEKWGGNPGGQHQA